MTETPPATGQDINPIVTVEPLPVMAQKRSRIQQRDQAARLQAFAYHSAMALQDAITDKDTGKITMNPQLAKAVKELVSAWDTAADRVRILRGKGLPQSVKAAGSAKPRQTLQPLD